MDALRRWGGYAGILAALALVWVGIAVVVVMPAAGLGPPVPYPHYDPAALLPFIAERPALFWLVNIAGGALAALFALVFFVALGDYLRAQQSPGGRIGASLAVIGASALAMEALLWQFGVGTLANLNKTDAVAASHAFFALVGAIRTFDVLGTAATGLGVVLLSTAMRRVGRYSSAAWVGIGGGILLFLSRFVLNRILFGVSALLAIVWLLWTGNLLRSESSRR